LPVGREFEHHAGVIQRQLLVIASFLGVVESFLADVSGCLLTVDPGLAIVESTELRVVGVRGVIAVLIVGALFVIDSCLIAVSEELFAVSDGLLEVAEALFARELS